MVHETISEVVAEDEQERSGVHVSLAAEVFTWVIDGYDVVMRRCLDGKWRPLERIDDALIIVWQTDELTYRAAIVNKAGTARLSGIRPSPRAALNECAGWFKAMFG